MDVFKMYIEKLEPLYLGQQYESDVYIVEINMEQWMVAYPTITHYELFVTSPNGTVYPAKTVFTGRTLTWMLTKEDTSVIGKGQYQILGLEAQGGYATKYSAIENIEIFPNMEGISDTTEVPEYAKSWAEEVARDAQMAAEAVEQIAGTAPYIGANGNWYTYFKSVNAYVDTGVSARGIKGNKGDKGDKGERGYTGATGPVGPSGEKGAKGDKGDKGDKGETGADGAKGDQGERGEKGDRGEKGEKGDPGYTPQKGVDYKDGENGRDGEDGEDGFTPVVRLERVEGGVKITTTNKGEPDHSQVVNDGTNVVDTFAVNVTSNLLGIMTADKTQAEIRQAVKNKEFVYLRFTATGENYYLYAGERADPNSNNAEVCPYFVSPIVQKNIDGKWVDSQDFVYVYSDKTVKHRSYTPFTAATTNALTIKYNGQTYKFDGSEAVTINISGTGGGAGSNADWAVNDPDASGYVKNRTHWVEEGMAYVMPVRDYVHDTGGVAQITSPLPDSIVAGAELVVNYNGTDYPAVVSAITIEGYDTLAFGCYGALTGGEMTADPYAFVVMPEETVANSGVYAAIFSLDGSTAFTFGIKASGEIVHKLDEKYIPDSVKTPTITITKQNDKYTADYPFEDAWAMAENVLQSAIVYVDKDSEWLERLSAASVSKLGTSSESGFDVIQIMLEPYYDATAHAIQKLCLAWTRFRENGFIRGVGIGVHQNLVLMDARSIPGFIAGPGLTANADKIEIKAGDGLHIPTEGIDFNNLTLNTMSSTAKGGAKVGKGLQMEGDVLGVVPDKPEELLLAIETKGEAEIIIDEIEGLPFALTQARVAINCSLSSKETVQFVAYSQADSQLVSPTASTTDSAKYTGMIVYQESGYWTFQRLAAGGMYEYGATYTASEYWRGRNRVEENPTINKFRITLTNKTEGTIIKIYGVRA